MTRVIMYGCNGYMGHVICDLINKMDDVQVVAGIDVTSNDSYDFPVFTDPSQCNVQADAIIDFSAAVAVKKALDFAVENQIPLVECTTGLSEEMLDYLKDCSRKVAILRSANMSLGVNALLKMVKTAAQILGEAGYDIEIVEKHHNQKLDAPSGTALALADAINEELDPKYEYVYDRSTRREKRPEKEIGISAVRGGSIVGDHDVLFCGPDEVITISHRAYSRGVFAKGAIEAAKFLAGKAPGMYDMQQVIGE